MGCAGAQANASLAGRFEKRAKPREGGGRGDRSGSGFDRLLCPFRRQAAAGWLVGLGGAPASHRPQRIAKLDAHLQTLYPNIYSRPGDVAGGALPVHPHGRSPGPGMPAVNAPVRRPAPLPGGTTRDSPHHLSAIPTVASVGLTETGRRPLSSGGLEVTAFSLAETSIGAIIESGMRGAPAPAFVKGAHPAGSRTKIPGVTIWVNHLPVNGWLEFRAAMTVGWAWQDPRQHPLRIPPLLRANIHGRRIWKRNHAPQRGPFANC